MSGHIETATTTPHTREPTERRPSLERVIAETWRQVLGVDSVHAQSNFFALGGHSLTAMHMAALLERHLGQRIPLSLIFEYPTVSALARHLGSRSDPGDEHTNVPEEEATS
jgi:acyl carrier protein